MREKLRKAYDSATAAANRTPVDPKPTGATRVPAPAPAVARQLWEAEVLAELRLLRETSTAATAREQAGGLVNDVLEVATHEFPASGVLAFDYRAAVGSVVVTNPEANEVTFAAGTASSDTAPATGKGVQVVPGFSWLAIPVGAQAFVLYGTAGDRVGVQAFTGMTAFGVTR